MKKISMIGPPLLLLSLLAACDKQLDLTPEDTLVDSQVFGSELATEQALADAYINLFRAVTGNIAYVIGDFTTENLQHSVFYDVYEDGSVVTADDGVQSVWQNYYRAINLANNIIVKTQQYAQYAAAKQAQFIAEARLIRAYAYLDLLKLFGDGALMDRPDGLGVPLQLMPFEGYDTGDIIPRSTNAQVYAQIIADLTEPMADLPDRHSNDLHTRSRATKGSAAALRARTWLYMHRFEDAAAAAAEVLQSRPAIYQLATNLLDLFPPNSDGQAKTLVPEYLFAFPVSHITSPSTSLNNNLSNGYFFKRSFWISPAFISMFGSGDLRAQQLIFKGDSIYNPDQFGERTTFKFNNSNGRDNVSVIRLAEVILTRAEALARTKGVTGEAVSLLNQVRSRSMKDAGTYSVDDFENPTALLAVILEERRKELAFEGFYRYDRIRNGQFPRDNGLPEGKWVLPIPQREIDISNGVIVQNPGYLN
ncbi:RagB/SusD family nutrient uptake outer membrane protein [Parapedobacter deserti]|uniref:RagB/SusD family nutrient uptake outer membrane protein n=1 Tax=Parapedobacter deserti TaxID=1912957 RepID=A0ABV7JFB1_9SPHI